MTPIRQEFDQTKFAAYSPEWAARLKFFANIGSTNEAARQSLRVQRRPELALWLTDQQAAGRGRLGRSWQAPAYSSLLFTLVFQLHLPLNQAFLYGAALALAIRKAAAQVAQIQLELKWPNDLLLAATGRKVAGILAELESNLGSYKDETWLALGCGLNVNVTQAEFAAAGLEDKAGALLANPDQPLAREELLAAILQEWDLYQKTLLFDPQQVRNEWSNSLLTIGKWVEVWMNGQVEAVGTAIGIDDNGALLIREASGFTRSFAAADVSVRLPDGRYSA
jgi:BirA family biotin operon repressor/biotin-[acetyl-CoA-carboxylase] ligase